MPARPGAFWSTGSSVILMSCRRVVEWTIHWPRAWCSAPGFQSSREPSQPVYSSALASESSRWRIVRPEIARSSGRRCGESNAAATRSRHGVERSHARSTT
jgi:hypothetical protein